MRTHDLSLHSLAFIERRVCAFGSSGLLYSRIYPRHELAVFTGISDTARLGVSHRTTRIVRRSPDGTRIA